MIDPQIIADDLHGSASLRQVGGSQVQCGTFSAAWLPAKNDSDWPRRRLNAGKKIGLDLGLENSLVFGLAEAVPRRIESHLFGREQVLAAIPGTYESSIFLPNTRDLGMVFQTQGGSFPVELGAASP
jgi:hypothetical protein